MSPFTVRLFQRLEVLISSGLPPNNSFNPNLLRYTKAMAGNPCQGFASTTQVGLTQALGLMKATDDPIVGARRERFRAHLPNTEDLALITLKGHLLVEEILDDIIAHHCRKPEALAGSRMGFQLKALLAHALAGDDSLPQQLWPMVDALRVLRNELAHKLESPKLEQVVSRFIAVAGAVGSDDQSSSVEQKLRISMAYMYGFLAAYEFRVRTGSLPPKLADA